MADFRKLVLALAVLALIAVPASAQVVTCAASSGAGSPLVRAEGLTELVGETVLTCVGTGATANIQVFLNTNVTNAVASGVLLNGATLTVEGTGQTVAGRLVGANSILWAGVNITAASAADPANTQRVIRIRDIRVNATQAPAAASGIPGQIVEFVSITSTTAGTGVSVFPAQVPVAVTAPGLAFSIGKGTHEAVATFQQCTGFLTDVTSTSNIGTPDNTFVASFRESFPTAFHSKVATATNIGEGTGATNGTRLFARFTNVPAGARVFVTNRNTGTAAPVAGYVAADGTTSTSGYTLVSLTNGTGTATWEVLDANDAGPTGETISFGVVVSIPANIPFETGTSITAQVAGGFAPVGAANQGVASAVSVPIPRFVDTSSPTDLFNITACVTNLLFPYVTNAAGFDTGIALVNTSLDEGVFDTTAQSGTCTVYYFGAMGNGSQVPAPQVTTEIEGGGMVAFLLSQGGVTGATGSAETFTGYVIARCNFQFGHGFAFISDLGGSKLAQGYLALVLPDRPTRQPDAFTVNGAGTGEQLGM